MVSSIDRGNREQHPDLYRSDPNRYVLRYIAISVPFPHFGDIAMSNQKEASFVSLFAAALLVSCLVVGLYVGMGGLPRVASSMPHQLWIDLVDTLLQHVR